MNIFINVLSEHTHDCHSSSHDALNYYCELGEHKRWRLACTVSIGGLHYCHLNFVPTVRSTVCRHWTQCTSLNKCSSVTLEIYSFEFCVHHTSSVSMCFLCFLVSI